MILIKSALEREGGGGFSLPRTFSCCTPSYDNDTKCRSEPHAGALWSFNHDPPGYERARAVTLAGAPDLSPALSPI